MRLVGISGSLRAGSSNQLLLAAAARLAPPGQTLTVYSELDRLPHFNPDLDTDTPPAAVQQLRDRFDAADGVLISTPEYIHGVPGGLKNCLDWLVGSCALAGKPTGLVLASAGDGRHATAALSEILATMGAMLLPEATISIPGSRATVRGGRVDASVEAKLAAVLAALAGARAAGLGAVLPAESGQLLS